MSGIVPRDADGEVIPHQPYQIAEHLQPCVVRIDSLTPWPANPRRGRVKLIRESLLSNGQYRPIVVWTEGNVVLAGNHTLKAAQELGGTHIARTVVDCDRATAARIVAVDNKASDLAEYDTGELVMLLTEIKKSDPTLAGSGFVQSDFDLFAGATSESSAAWSGMPEFKQENKTGFQSVVVHFASPADRDAFAELVEQPMTDKTRAMWYPTAAISERTRMRYADGSVQEPMFPPEADVAQAELDPVPF